MYLVYCACAEKVAIVELELPKGLRVLFNSFCLFGWLATWLFVHPFVLFGFAWFVRLFVVCFLVR